MKNYVQTLNEFINEQEINEKLFMEQIPWILDLKPGNVIYAKADYTEADINFARMAKTKVGKITKLNVKNMIKGGYTDVARWDEAKSGDLIAIVYKGGDLRTVGGFVSNIKHIGTEDVLLAGLNILLTDDKIEIKQYNPKNDEERIEVFRNNLYDWNNENVFNYKNYEIPKNAMNTESNFKYDRKTDILIFNEVYNQDGEMVASLRIKNASNDKDLTRDGKYLFEI